MRKNIFTVLFLLTVFLHAGDIIISSGEGAWLHFRMENTDLRDGKPVPLDHCNFTVRQQSSWADAEGADVSVLQRQGSDGTRILKKGNKLQIVTEISRYTGIYSGRENESIALLTDGETRLIPQAFIQEILLLGDAEPFLTLIPEQPGTSKKTDIDYGFHTPDLRWQAEYDLIRISEKNAELTGWYRLINSGNGELSDAEVTLISGNIQNDPTAGPGIYRAYAKSAAVMESSPIQDESYDYYIFKIQGTVDIEAQSENRRSLFGRREVNTETRYYFRGFDSRPMEGPASIEVSFRNDSDGILPSGTVNIYDDSRVWLGTSSARQYSSGETVEITAGTAQDLWAERIIEEQKRMRNYEDVEIKYVLQNHSRQKRTVILEERITGNHTISGHSHPYEEKNADTVTFTVEVPAGKDITLKYKYSKVF